MMKRVRAGLRSSRRSPSAIVAPALAQRNRPISCCATGSPPIPPIPTSRPTSRACPTSPRPISRPRSNSAGSPRIVAAGDVPARPRLRRQPADAGSDRGLAQGRRQGLDLGDGRTRRALWHRRRRRAGTRRRRANCSSARRRPAIRAASANLAALGGGAGAPSDPARARELLAKAAETNAEAQYQLGMMLAEGTGGPKDDAAARALFEKAAAQNHPGALERMGAFAQRAAAGRRIPTPPKPITSAPPRSAMRTPRRRWSGCAVPM